MNKLKLIKKTIIDLSEMIVVKGGTISDFQCTIPCVPPETFGHCPSPPPVSAGYPQDTNGL